MATNMTPGIVETYEALQDLWGTLRVLVIAGGSPEARVRVDAAHPA